MLGYCKRYALPAKAEPEASDQTPAIQLNLFKYLGAPMLAGSSAALSSAATPIIDYFGDGVTCSLAAPLRRG